MNEVKAIVIDASLTASGQYSLSFNGETISNIRFAGSDINNNTRRIKEGLTRLSSIGSNDILVVYDL